MISRYVLIVAGGSGERMKSDIPKQFIEINGKPLLMHTLEVFYNFDINLSVVVVLPENQISYWQEKCQSLNCNIRHSIIKGGENRFQSVRNGLTTIPDEGIVAIHDGVRPFVTRETISRCFSEAEKFGNAIPCIPIHDTVRLVVNDTSAIIDRSMLRSIQTPQVFLNKIIKEAFNQPYINSFTDDASVFEKSGGKVHLVEGNRENIKITDPFDLTLAKCLLNI